MDDRQTLQWLADRAAITDVVTAFAVALDTRNWALFRQCLADPVEVDYPDSIGVATYAVDDLIAVGQGFFGNLDATLHVSANHFIEIDGDKATCMSTLLASHYLASAEGQQVQRQVGYYINHLDRLDRWRISRTEQHQSWTDGNGAIFTHAASGVG